MYFVLQDYFIVYGDNVIFIVSMYYRMFIVFRQLGSGVDFFFGVIINKSMFEIIVRDFLLERIDCIVEFYEGIGFKW